MSTSKSNPNPLDVLDSKVNPDNVKDYKTRLESYHSTLDSYWKFEIVPGIFKQSDPNTDETKFDYLKENFGKIGSWDDIIEKLNHLNSSTKPNEQYKIMYLARHGQGFHNLAHTKYGDNAWNEYWSKLNGDGEIIWGPDANLTELGISQAKDNNYIWKQQQTNNKNQVKDLIIPTKFLVSPLSRSIDTMYHTWNDIVDLKTVNPLIQENWRETMGVHTCDKRSTRTIIDYKYTDKGFIIEPGFVEEDIYYQDDYRETVGEQAIRINKGLQQLFNECPNDQIVAITSHSGSIRAQLLAVGHRSFAVGTGGMIPVFVKATKIVK
ncbi:putative phosphoglycerate mutase [Spathaspora sp. JA1]|nr:putative phosphoglycerate mutase [Spathaspora sp. JA1]